MLVLRDPALASRIANSEIRSLVTQRFAEVCAGEVYNYDEHGYMIVVEPGDSVEALEQESSLPILRNLFDEVTFPNPEFSPTYEALEEHHGCYEILFITTDSGFGITFFIPKEAGIDASLLAMCAEYASPAISR